MPPTDVPMFSPHGAVLAVARWDRSAMPNRIGWETIGDMDMARVPARLSRTLIDTVLPIVVAVLLFFVGFVGMHRFQANAPWTLYFLLPSLLTLLWVRRNPLWASGLAAAGTGATMLAPWVPFMGAAVVAIGFYYIARLRSLKLAGIPAAIFLAAGFVGIPILDLSSQATSDYAWRVAELGAWVVVSGLSIGVVITWWTRNLELEARTRVLQRVTQEQRTRGDLLEERTQLARDLHDALGHHVSAMVIQCEAGRSQLDHQDVALAGRLGNIADSGRAALAELDRIVAVLRDDRPDPTFSGGRAWPHDVRRLVSLLEEMGIDVSLELSASLDDETQRTAAFRVLQEALTNVARHSQATKTYVATRAEHGLFVLEVTDDGIGFDPRRQNGRSGLRGMEERLASVGGDLWIESANRVFGSGSIRPGTRLVARIPRQREQAD